jgi:hypothetical protein
MKHSMEGIELSNWMAVNCKRNKMSKAKRNTSGIAINDADYNVSITTESGKIVCPAYSAWRGIILRVFNKSYHEKYPTYNNVSICNEWLKFSKFREWWILNYKPDCTLDKDILSYGKGKEYSPSNCIFIPNWLNTFIVLRDARRGESKLGCYYNKAMGKFMAQCRNPKTKKQEYLGLFDNDTEANLAWLKKKLELSYNLKSEMDEIDIRIYPNIIAIIQNSN